MERHLRRLVCCPSYTRTTLSSRPPDPVRCVISGLARPLSPSLRAVRSDTHRAKKRMSPNAPIYIIRTLRTQPKFRAHRGFCAGTLLAHDEIQVLRYERRWKRTGADRTPLKADFSSSLQHVLIGRKRAGQPVVALPFVDTPFPAKQMLRRQSRHRAPAVAVRLPCYGATYCPS